jgi:hypothetical protein
MYVGNTIYQASTTAVHQYYQFNGKKLTINKNGFFAQNWPESPKKPGLPDFSWHMIPKPEKCTK